MAAVAFLRDLRSRPGPSTGLPSEVECEGAGLAHGARAGAEEVAVVDGHGLTFDEQPTGIVVGWDGSRDGDLALRWAVAEAAMRSVALHVVHAWTLASAAHLVDAPFGTTPSLAECEVAARTVLDAAVDAVLAHAEQDPPRVVRHLVHGNPGAVLVEAAERADLLVVGTRGIEGFVGLLLGSVAEKVLRHAACSVLVVR